MTRRPMSSPRSAPITTAPWMKRSGSSRRRPVRAPIASSSRPSGQRRWARRSTPGLPDLKAAAGRCGVHFTATPFDLEALRDLVAVGAPLLKIASGDLTYTDLLEAGAATGLPLVVSTGAANLAEVDEAMRTMQSAGATQIALMHCASAYPATFEMANVRAVATLIAAFGVPVGFSDHTPGHAAALAAVALGGRLIEKHITFDRAQPGPDHSYALSVAEFADMVSNLRALEASLGSGVKEPVEAELGERRLQ